MPLYSSDTVSLARPFARRAAKTRRPFFVAILSRKPCLFFLFLLEGWNVLFIVVYCFYVYYSMQFAIRLAKVDYFFQTTNYFLSKICIIRNYLFQCPPLFRIKGCDGRFVPPHPSGCFCCLLLDYCYNLNLYQYVSGEGFCCYA